VLRTKFQLESVAEFRRKLKSLGSGLLVAHDQPEVFIKKLMDRTLQTTVVYQQEVCDEERRVENALKE
jgi:deoxyribodipyrimidine photo-lyase